MKVNLQSSAYNIDLEKWEKDNKMKVYSIDELNSNEYLVKQSDYISLERECSELKECNVELMQENEYVKHQWEEQKEELAETINKYEQLKQENKQLKDNWNKLKEYFKFEIEFDKRWFIPECEEYTMQKHFPEDTLDGFRYALDKIQELESGDSDEQRNRF